MFNFVEIEIEMIQRAEKRAESKLKIRPAKFGAAMYFRRFKKIKPKNFTRIEPPILKQSNPFSGESCPVPIEKRFKGGKRPQISF